MKFPRSFSLLTFLLVATIIAIGFALYQANMELAEKELLFEQQSEQLGFIDAQHDSQLYFRKLGGYPAMSFAFRYQLPKGHDYKLKVGSGVTERDFRWLNQQQRTGRKINRDERDFPPVILERQLKGGELQNTLAVSLRRFPQALNDCWIVECVDNGSMRREVFGKKKFAWLDMQDERGLDDLKRGYVQEHGPVEMVHSDREVVVLIAVREMSPNPNAMFIGDGVLQPQTFMIWLERVKSDKRDPTVGDKAD